MKVALQILSLGRFILEAGMFQRAVGLFRKWNQSGRVEGQQLMAISCSQGNFSLVRKNKISEWVDSGTGCLEAEIPIPNEAQSTDGKC